MAELTRPAVFAVEDGGQVIKCGVRLDRKRKGVRWLDTSVSTVESAMARWWYDYAWSESQYMFGHVIDAEWSEQFAAGLYCELTRGCVDRLRM